jgi:hypothetical protein
LDGSAFGWTAGRHGRSLPPWRSTVMWEVKKSLAKKKPAGVWPKPDDHGK